MVSRGRMSREGGENERGEIQTNTTRTNTWRRGGVQWVVCSAFPMPFGGRCTPVFLVVVAVRAGAQVGVGAGVVHRAHPRTHIRGAVWFLAGPGNT